MRIRSCSLIWVVLLVGCGGAPDAVSFDETEGAADGLSDCTCTYYDGTHGDWGMQLSCDGNATFSNLSFFLDPRVKDSDQEAQLIFQRTDGAGVFRGGGVGRFTKVGKRTRPDEGRSQIIRSVEGLEVRWEAQDACDVNGCAADSFRIEAGAMRAGEGGCEDHWATIDDLGG